MVFSVQLYADMLAKKETPESLLQYYADYYKNKQFIKVSAADDETAAGGFLAGNGLAGWDGLKCMNIILGCDESKGLDL